jgi:hypothetical protein
MGENLLFYDEAGTRVPAGSPAAYTQFAPDDPRRPDAPGRKAIKAPPEDKAVKAPPATKGKE